MKIRQLILLLFSGMCLQLYGQASFEEKVTSVSNVGMTINNLGMVGNSFGGSFDVLGYPSCEFPVGSGVEHIFDGGLWIGAKINGTTVAVTSGAVDASSGYSTGRSGFEFSAAQGSGLDTRSSLFDSPYFSIGAVSHEDFVSDFSDSAIFVPGTSIQIQEHDNPLDVAVHFESYNWNYSFANFFVILNYTVTNVGTQNLDELYLGYWVDGVVRNVNITPPGGTSFYNKGGNGFLDSLTMGYEWDVAGEPQFTNSYVGTKFLGATDKTGFHHPNNDSSYNTLLGQWVIDTTFKAHYNTWQFNNSADPLYFFPSDDNAKYSKMNTGLNHRLDWNAVIRPNIATANNRSNLVSVGPFTTLAPGESVNVAFAIVLARRNNDGNVAGTDSDEARANLEQNAGWAQTAFNGEDGNGNGFLDIGEDKDNDMVIDRYILPTPPSIPHTRFEATDHSVTVYWTNNAEASIDPISNKQDFEGYRLYKTQLGFDVQEVQDVLASLELVGQFDQAGNGLFYDTGLDGIRLANPVTFEGDTNTYRYAYTFDKLQNGWQHAIALTAFDTGDEVNNLESLESSAQANMRRVFPGKAGNSGFANGDPFVYPNPYYAGASWEGTSTFEEDRKIMFANLPPHCEVRIYTVAGDLVDSFEHDEDYTGEDIRWFDTYSDTENTKFSGGEHAWDLLSKDNQIIARGIYLFAVKDLDSGDLFQGKFVVIK